MHEYPGMVNELASGPVIAMEIMGKSPEHVPMAFRELCGPMDPVSFYGFMILKVD